MTVEIRQRNEKEKSIRKELDEYYNPDQVGEINYFLSSREYSVTLYFKNFKNVKNYYGDEANYKITSITKDTIYDLIVNFEIETEYNL